MRQDLVIRRAEIAEAGAVAALYRRAASREWPFMAPRSPEEDRVRFQRCFAQGVVWAAYGGETLWGFCALRRGWIDHLFVDHARHDQGLGGALLDRARQGRTRLRLWTFQRNARSRSFYARRGFLPVLFTDGSANEEKEPDVCLEWRRRAGSERRPGA